MKKAHIDLAELFSRPHGGVPSVLMPLSDDDGVEDNMEDDTEDACRPFPGGTENDQGGRQWNNAL